MKPRNTAWGRGPGGSIFTIKFSQRLNNYVLTCLSKNSQKRVPFSEGGSDLNLNQSMTPKKYPRLKILPPKNTPSPPVGLCGESPPGVQCPPHQVFTHHPPPQQNAVSLSQSFVFVGANKGAVIIDEWGQWK